MRVIPGMVAGVVLLAPPQQTFRSTLDVVEVYATVTDRDGRLVPNLAEADFEVLDNGRRQTIAAFARGTQPITIAIMIDESPSVFDVLGRIRSGVDAFARHLVPGDRATVGAFSHLVRIDPLLTADPAELVRRLEAGRPRFPAGTALWDGLAAAGAALEREGGRRVILVLTDADDNCSEADPDDVRRQVERDGTMVYAIGVRGESGLPARELRDLTRDSGGYYFELRPRDALEPAFARVADELHSQYVLGFVPAALDGKPHEITVRVNRSALTVRARRTHVAGGQGGAS
jgi:Ca-activated chloride channel family protein